MRRPRLFIGAILVCLTLGLPIVAQQFSNTGKKLIEAGWDIREPAYIRANVAKIEQYPFDGVIFRLENYNMAFDFNAWPEEILKPMAADVKAIKWWKFDSNFMILYAAVNAGMSWFDDAQWKNILNNVSKYARIAREGKCAGIVFDPEPYGKDPWVFPGDYPNKSYSEVAAQVRLRGIQWMEAVQHNWSNMRLFLFTMEISPTENKEYMLGQFCNGLLEGARPDVKIINGNEYSYYHTSSQNYINDALWMKGAAQDRIDPKLKAKFSRTIQLGMAVYMDQSLALRQPPGDYISFYMTPEDRLKYFEHSIYWALKTADEYAWCYSERLDWWDAIFPKGADDAIHSARRKLEDGKGLGFALAPRIQSAKRSQEAISAEKQK